MSRPLRIEYPGAWYHVMNRGAGKKNIFHNDLDRNLFLKSLRQSSKRCGAEIHGYCLMSNHYHLLVHTPLGNLSKVMRYINGQYTQKFNTANHTDGPLFRGRYKSILVDSEKYLLTLSRYIHLNPVEAKIVTHPEQYKWSSYQAYIGWQKNPEWLITEDILTKFGDQEPIKLFQQFTDEGIDDETRKFYKRKRLKAILGGKEFTKTISEQYLKDASIDREIPELNKVKYCCPPTIEKIIKNVADYYNMDREALLISKRGLENIPRLIGIHLAVELSTKNLTEIGKHFNNSNYSTISKSNRRFIITLKENPILDKAVNELANRIRGQVSTCEFSN